MPISSSKNLLNKQKFRPPPKSLEQILWEEEQKKVQQNVKRQSKNETEEKERHDTNYLDEFSGKNNKNSSREQTNNFDRGLSEVKHNGTLFSERNVSFIFTLKYYLEKKSTLKINLLLNYF